MSSVSKETKRRWEQANPPDEFGYYVCGICGGDVIASQLSLDHIRSQYQYPELKNDITNLQASHAFCNQEKGSGADDGTRVVKRYGRSKRTVSRKSPYKKH